MNKRGISPLIASVLLIAFTITLFLIISTWVQRSMIEPGLEKGGEKVATTLDCMSAKVDIIRACKEGDAKVKVIVDNIGEMELTGLTMRVVGSTNTDIAILSETMAPLQRKKVGKEGLAIGTISSVEVYPELKSGLCKSNPSVKTTFEAYANCA